MELMHILHAIDTLDPALGGPPQMLAHLSALQVQAGLHIRVLTHLIPGRRQAVEQFITETAGEYRPQIHMENAGRWERLTARGIAAVLPQHIRDCDVAHLHGLWSPLLYRSAAAAHRAGVPYIVRPAGMLEPWSLQQRRMKKKLMLQLAFRRMLERASVLHATAIQEAEQFRRLGLTRPIAVIPNGVNVACATKQPSCPPLEQTWPKLAGKKLLLFMSRVHPKKGLLNLAQAMGRVAPSHPDWHVVVAGPDDNGHQQEVASAFQQAAVSDRVTFTGPIFGESKTQLLQACHVFVLPTYSENFGIVVAEALAAGKPVITTHGTPWSELNSHRCGWWIPIGVEPLTAALEQAMQLHEQQRLDMGQRGRVLIESRYAWPAVVEQITQMYAWINGREPQPKFVYCFGQSLNESTPPASR